MSGYYYVKAIAEDGTEIYFKVYVHHWEFDRIVNYVSEKEMKKEIEEHNKENAEG